MGSKLQINLDLIQYIQYKIWIHQTPKRKELLLKQLAQVLAAHRTRQPPTLGALLCSSLATADPLT